MSENQKICTKCGAQNDGTTMFCSKCGTMLASNVQNNQSKAPDCFNTNTFFSNTEEKSVQNIYTKSENGSEIKNKRKCQYCGVWLDETVEKCTSCGGEIKNQYASQFVAEFMMKYQEIERNNNATTSSWNVLDSATQQKAELIRNYPVPNEKEDLVEFFLLANSNINLNKYGMNSLTKNEIAISDAWEAKTEQIYEKARLTIKNTKEFEQIEAVYGTKKADINKGKKKGVVTLIVTVICVIIFAFISISFAICSTDKLKTDKQKEIDRLEELVDEVYEAYEDGDYALAKSIALKIEYSLTESGGYEELSEKWDNTREELLDMIEEAEDKADNESSKDDEEDDDKEEIESETNTSICAPIIAEDLDDETYSEIKEMFTDEGFTNIILKEVNDLSEDDRENVVTSITIDGDSDYDEEDYFDCDVEVVIEYHTVKTVVMLQNEDDYRGLNYERVVKELENRGFVDIEVVEETVSESEYDDESVLSIEIDGDNFDIGDEFKVTASVLVVYCKIEIEETAGAPDDWMNLLEKHYEEVKKQFEDAGFTNVTCVGHEIDFDENYVFEGSVLNIAVGEDGDICTFEKGEQWAKDIPIRIDYRIKPEKPDTTVIVLPPEDSKLGKDLDTEGSRTVYYINTDNITNKPSTTKWGGATVTDGVAEYLDYLEELGFTVTIKDTVHKEPYSGFHTYDTSFEVSNDSVTWTMDLYIQKELYVEYELDVHLN